MAKLYPVGSTIFIQPEEIPDTSRGGIFIPDILRTKPSRGKVIAVPDKLETGVKVGVTILFPPNALKQFVVDDENYYTVAEEHIYGFCE